VPLVIEKIQAIVKKTIDSDVNSIIYKNTQLMIPELAGATFDWAQMTPNG